MSVPWPIAFLRPFPESGRPMTGWILRLLGLLSIGALGLGAFGSVVGISLVAKPRGDGFSDLAGAIALMLGIGLLVLGGLVSLAVHLCYVPWSAGKPARRRLQITSWTFIAIGLAYLPVYLFLAETRPLDDYILVALLGHALAGGLLLTDRTLD